MRWVTVGIVLAAVLAGGCTIVGDLIPQGPTSGPGAAYEGYLAGSTDTIVVELDHVPGASWGGDTPAESDFVRELERLTQKEVLVRANGELPEHGADYVYSLAELRELHDQHLDEQPDAGTEVMHALFLDGRFEEESIGVAYDTRAFALFKGEIRRLACGNDDPVCHVPCPEGEPVCLQMQNPSTREWKVTRAIALHEAGHLAGLVNSPLAMVEDHEDAEHPGHTTNTSSVMHWQVEIPGGIQDYAEGPEGREVPWRFGEHAIQDARAFQQEG